MIKMCACSRQQQKQCRVFQAYIRFEFIESFKSLFWRTHFDKGQTPVSVFLIHRKLNRNNGHSFRKIKTLNKKKKTVKKRRKEKANLDFEDFSMFLKQRTNILRGACPWDVLSEQPCTRKFFFGYWLGLLLGSGNACESEIRGLFGCGKG